MMFENIEQVIAIVGCQRSGTTLTGQILGAHPNALLIDETDGLYKWFNQIQSSVNPLEFSTSLLRKAIKKYTSNHSRTIETSKSSSDAGDDIKLSSHVTHLILKAPNLTYSYSSFAKLCVPVKVVYPVRDVRAVVSSMEKLPHIPFIENQIRWINRNDVIAKRFANELMELNSSNLNDNEKRAIIWKIKTGLASDFRSAGLPVKPFRYEQLISNRQKTVREIANFTDLSFSESMLAHENTYVGLGPGGTKRSRSIDNKSLNKWRNHMPLKSEMEILRIAAPLLNSLGYSSLPNY